MTPSTRIAALAVCAALGAACPAAFPQQAGTARGIVETQRVPSGGIQPQAVACGDGTVYLLYYSGDPKAGDLFYTTRGPGADGWSPARRVNSQPGSAVAIGNDRGGQLALGRRGAAHVAWNGSGRARPSGPERSCPMLYTRLVPGQDAFEPQRNLLTRGTHLDGGGSVATDLDGHVYVVWHAAPLSGTERGEASRRVFVAASADDGATFGPEAPRSDSAAGACGCCGLRAAAMPGGELLVLYRGAAGGTERGMRLMRSADHGATFSDALIDPWELTTCPMTTASIVPGPAGPLLAWETRQDVRWAVGAPGAGALAIRSVGEPGENRRFPSLAVDAEGRILLAWTEGMGWGAGGRVCWATFGPDGKPLDGGRGRAEGVPPWSLVGTVARPGGGFLVIY